MKRAAILLLAVVACGGGKKSVALGPFTVHLDHPRGALELTHSDGMRLATVEAAAIGFRQAVAHYDEQYGAFKLSETSEPEISGAWSGLDTANGGAKVDIIDAGGATIGSLALLLVQDSLQLTISAVDPAINRVTIRLGCDDATAGGFLGFGAQTHDVDHRGQIVPIWVSEQGIGTTDTDTPSELWPLVGTRHSSYLPVPQLLAPRAGASYGLRAATFHHSIWDLCATDPARMEITIWEGKVSLSIAPGPTPLEVVAQQSAENGRLPLGPDWTFGLWMERVGGQQAVLDEAALIRSQHIPASAIWSEDWRGGMQEGRSYALKENWRVDRSLYPEVEQMITELHQRGLKFMTYFNTFVVQGSDIYDEAVSGDHLVKDRRGNLYLQDGVSFQPTGLAELFRPATATFVAAELKRALDLGVDGWMADYGEWYPADQKTAPADGSDPEAAHQRYPLAWAQLNRDVIDTSGREIVSFHRSGYLGAQGVTPVIWAGDQRTSFQADDGLPTVIPILMGLSTVGFPVVTHDIGGYISSTNPPGTKDLFFRWATLGALGPVMRTHHGRDAFANWRWSSDAETVAHFRRWAELHTRLFPLWRALARQASETGAPILRPMAFFDPGDTRLHGIKDAYAIGDVLLVAPVVTASTSTRTVIFPRGRWVEFNAPPDTADVETGPSAVIRPVPIGEAAIYARAGAVIPLLPEGVESLVPGDGLVDLATVRGRHALRVWLGADGSGEDGDARFELLSPAVPEGVLTVVSGGTRTASSTRSVSVTAAANTTLDLIDGAGHHHSLRSSAMAASDQLAIELRW